MIENKHTELKQKVTPELEKEVVAFLNSNEEEYEKYRLLFDNKK